MTNGPVKKEKGVRHLIAASRYSFQGFVRLLREEAFRHELLGFVIGVIVFFLAGATATQFMVFIILMFALFAAEALNTAVEELVDRVSPERSVEGKHAKDLGSFATFCLICCNFIYAIAVVFF
ncbi:diacylglycerol kinase [Martelella mediterranea]|uniref:Diacylglycerol kinase n=1 Tax=Martelella mediterranea TaxID=293089 RepID=A0A4R3NZ99_9HYPH|nr:diacylglycerol kinase [Martelella mediterranea]TCT40920.1 diacylglycerol kinase [Martelella mediterranea]